MTFLSLIQRDLRNISFAESDLRSATNSSQSLFCLRAQRYLACSSVHLTDGAISPVLFGRCVALAAAGASVMY